MTAGCRFERRGAVDLIKKLDLEGSDLSRREFLGADTDGDGLI